MERLQKILSEYGVCSRREAERRLTAGRVMVNGVAATVGDKADPERDTIIVDGQPLPGRPSFRTVVLHKPRGFVTTLSDEEGRRTILDFLEDIPQRLVPVGRLDMNSEGLLILTNDGALVQALTHPSREVDKEYLAWVNGDLRHGMSVLTKPMELDGVPVAPLEIHVLKPFEGGGLMRFLIHEGRNRQVRRMCEKAGLTVTRLKRTAVGAIRLEEMTSGNWRELTADEAAWLHKLKSDARHV